MPSSHTPEQFMEYFRSNYPGRTIISNPDWHAPKIYRAAMDASGHAELLEALKDADALLSKVQKVLAEWIVPDSGISDHDCLGSLLGLTDGPEQREVQGKTRAAIAKAEGGQS